VTGPLIVGYSGSPESHDALTLTRVLAPALQLPVVAVSVITSAPLEIDPRTFTTELDELAERLPTEARVALAGIEGVEAKAITGPSPARELERIAKESGAAMIVLGSTHRGSIGRVVPGTVANRLTAGGPCPIAIAPRGFAGSNVALDSIGVGFDGSREAETALALAGEIAQACAASLDLIAVINPHVPFGPPWASEGYAGAEVAPQIARVQVDGMWKSARTAVRRLVPAEVRATIHVLEGVPADVLADRSEQLDMLVVGSRGHGPAHRALTGSVSSEVARRATCPVIVTTRPDKAAAAASVAEHRRLTAR
jgi:nucleotide-binding universal stress UspA family protein